jgi:hypothetical protein
MKKEEEMLAPALFALALFVPQAGKPVALPDTPQGRHVQAYIDAFNTGDEKQFLAMTERHFEPALLKRRPEPERAKMFQRMRGDFAAMKVSKVLKASAEEIKLAIPAEEGALATFSFSFESTAPFRITGLSVEIDNGG